MLEPRVLRILVEKLFQPWDESRRGDSPRAGDQFHEPIVAAGLRKQGFSDLRELPVKFQETVGTRNPAFCRQRKFLAQRATIFKARRRTSGMGENVDRFALGLDHAGTHGHEAVEIIA